jgi:hypothetical protein
LRYLDISLSADPRSYRVPIPLEPIWKPTKVLDLDLDRSFPSTIPLYIIRSTDGGPVIEMVSLKVDADALLRGSEGDPIVAKVKGAGKDGSIGIHVSGDKSSPLSALVKGDRENPLSVSIPEIDGLVSTLAALGEGLKVGVTIDQKRPVEVALGRIPVDLTISVSSPAQEKIFTVEIKGSIGE